MWKKKKEKKDIMCGTPRFEKISGYEFSIPFSLVDKVLCSALMRGLWIGEWTQEQWDGIRSPSSVVTK